MWCLFTRWPTSSEPRHKMAASPEPLNRVGPRLSRLASSLADPPLISARAAGISPVVYGPVVLEDPTLVVSSPVVLEDPTLVVSSPVALEDPTLVVSSLVVLEDLTPVVSEVTT